MNPIKRMLVMAATSTAGLVVLANPAAATAGDGDVDGRDFLIWASPSTPTAAYGDGDVDGRDFLIWASPARGDGDVDGRDFLIWQRG
jgi:hypothetical protein